MPHCPRLLSRLLLAAALTVLPLLPTGAQPPCDRARTAVEVAQAEAPLEEAPHADARGDWLRNVGYVTGKVPSRSLMPGSLWRVVADRTPGRAEPGAGPKVRTFARGTVLQADVGRGGSDEVLENARDASGRPWMRVRSADGTSLGCYVRANKALIRPVRVGEKI